jgi:YVTN family beta-propeller protein
VPGLPSGAVTFLFTDIEGSTRLARQLGPRYAGVLTTHRLLLREAFRNHSGHEVDTQGDSFFVAFANARDALQAALESQLALNAHPWPDGTQVRVRMGIHTGVAESSETGYTGLAVHRAARISAAGHGGQVLVSQSTEALLEDEVEALGVGLRDLGEQRLKDLDRPLRLYQLDAPGLPQQFPPLRTVDAEQTRRRRRQLVLGAVAAVVIVAVAVGAILATRPGDEGALRATPNSVAVIDPASNGVERVISVGRTPTSVAFGEGAVWVLNSDEQTVSRLDPRSGELLRTEPVPSGASELAVGAGALWVATNHGTVTRIDPQGGLRPKTFSLPKPSGGAAGPTATQVAANAHSVWAGGPGVVVRLVPGLRRHLEDPFCCGALAIGVKMVWATDEQGVLEVDPVTNARVGHVQLVFGNHIAAGAGSVWVPDQRTDQVWRLDASTGRILDVPKVGRNPGGVAVGAGAVWVASADGTVARIDASSGAVRMLDVGGTPNDLVVGNGRVWVTVD